MCYTTHDVGGCFHCSFGDAKSLKGGSAMKKFIKAALEWLDKAMDVGKVLTDTGKALVDLFDEDKED